MNDLNASPKHKVLSSSCNSCQRMTVIEGEFICFREGKITSLTPMKKPSLKSSLICDGWKIGKLNF
ncbi:hypothetical protein AB4298_09475 [Shewanella sp. 10N.261.52.F9]|uniref:hypothetical protein n=1 Tax=Shewanella sp. 10N.261.52.F9 TaxID=3229684 RepID=UPI00354E8ECE